MPFTWMSRLLHGRSADERLATGRRGSSRFVRQSRTPFRPNLDALEDRITPAVNVLQNVPGAAFDNTLDPLTNTDANFRTPAEPSIAVGLNRIVEIVNNTVFVLDKTGAVLSQTNIFDFSGVVPPNSPDLGDQVVYDDTNGLFYISYVTQAAGGAIFYHFDQSLNSTPNNYLTDFVGINGLNLGPPIPGNSPTTGVPIIPIDVRIGYNREAVFFTYDQVTTIASATAPAGAYDSTTLIVASKSPATTGLQSFQLSNLNYGMAPAQMHNAPAGSPEIFVGTNGIGNNGTPFGSSSLRVTYMTNVTSATPTFRTINVGVSNYGNGQLPNAPQPGDVLDTFDTAITNAAWRNNTLVAAQTAKINGKDEVRWYQINAANNGALLSQSGNIDGGPGVFTFFPRIDISARGDLGIAFNASSASMFLSTYVTGRAAADLPNFLQTPVLIMAGQATYTDSNGSPYLPGRTTGIGVDPAHPNNFYSIGMWASAALPTNNWALQIANFTMSQAAASQIRLFSPVRFAYDANTGIYTGNVAVVNTLDIVAGTFVLVFNIPDPSITMLAPGGITDPVTQQFFITFTGTFTPGQVLRFPIQYQTPLKIPVPTFYLSGFGDLE
jgi:hypothetical protein